MADFEQTKNECETLQSKKVVVSVKSIGSANSEAQGECSCKKLELFINSRSISTQPRGYCLLGYS